MDRLLERQGGGLDALLTVFCGPPLDVESVRYAGTASVIRGHSAPVADEHARPRVYAPVVFIATCLYVCDLVFLTTCCHVYTHSMFFV